jgi:hypothetical protein
MQTDCPKAKPLERMRHMHKIKPVSLFCALAICLGAALGWGLRPSFLHQGKPVAQLWIPPDALNMGTIWEDGQFAWTVPIENREASAVEVESFGTTCNCLSIQPESFVLAPGERRQLQMRINLTSQVKETGEVAVGLWAQVKKEDRKPGEPLGPEWQIVGQVRRVLKFNRRPWYLGQHSELAQPLPVQTIPLEILVPLQCLSAECDLVGFSINVRRLDEGKAVLELCSVTPRSVGAFEGTISLQPALKGGELLPVQRLQFEGKIVPDIEAVPPAVQVGGRVLGDALEEVVQLRSLTRRELVGVRAQPEGEGLAVEPVEDNLRFRIRQRVIATGSTTNRIHFYAKVAGREVECILPVSYTGVESN